MKRGRTATYKPRSTWSRQSWGLLGQSPPPSPADSEGIDLGNTLIRVSGPQNHEIVNFYYLLFVCFFLFCLFRATPATYGGSQARGLIGATDASLHHSHSNARSLIHQARPGIEPTTSCFLVGFVSAAPQQELLVSPF